LHCVLFCAITKLYNKTARKKSLKKLHFLLALRLKVCYISKITTATCEGLHMLTITNTHTNKEATTFEDGTVETNYFTTYETKGAVKLAMDSIWKYEGKDTVNVESVQVIKTVSEDGEYTMVNVEHDTTWDIYTDTGFEAAISKLVGEDVTFTEQGMQDDNYASMEL